MILCGLAACQGAPNLPAGERTCLGFPPDVCQRQVEELEREGAAHGGVVAYRILCVSATCNADRGDGSIAVVFADGTGREGGFGYAAADEMPPDATFGPLPVAPVCVGVEPEQCDEFARAGAEQVADWSTIVSITVRCTATCAADAGGGETVVTVRDGPPVRIAWEYQSGS